MERHKTHAERRKAEGLPIFHRDGTVTFDGSKIVGRWERGGRDTWNYRHHDGTELNARYPKLNLQREIRRRFASPTTSSEGE